jgi:capsular polysaccharide biosynthesis protein
MSDSRWRVEAVADEDLTGAPRPVVATWHYLAKALRRRWRLLATLSLLGLLLGVAGFAALPAKNTGTVTLLMAHPANLDATSAMGTDVSLLGARGVSERTVRALDLDMSPDDFGSMVTGAPVTTEVMTITVSAPDKATALEWAAATTKEYLAFRAASLRGLNSGFVDGYRTRIEQLQGQVKKLNTEYAGVSAQGEAGSTRASEILNERAGLNTQINDLQQALEEATLNTEAAISGTRVVDPARPDGRRGKQVLVMSAVSGLIGGAAIGVGFVVLNALTSDRVRSRRDVAVALGAPVRFSVPGWGAGSRVLQDVRNALLTRFSSGAAPRSREPNRDLEVLVQGLELAVRPLGQPEQSGAPPRRRSPTTSGPPRGVALAAIGDSRLAATVLRELASRLRSEGSSVFVVDLSASGAMAASGPPAPPGLSGPSADAQVPLDGAAAPRRLDVFRPHSVPALARGPRGEASPARGALPLTCSARAAWDAADVILALVEVDPGIDVEALASWVDQVVPLVTAGRSSAELLETTAQLIRSAGLTLPFAMLTGSDRLDLSPGIVTDSEVRVSGVAAGVGVAATPG